MKKTILFMITLLSLLSWGNAISLSAPYEYSAVVDRVIDGDTFEMTIKEIKNGSVTHHQGEKIRLAHINCPEA